MIFLFISILVVQIQKSALRIIQKANICKFYNSTIFWTPMNGSNAVLQYLPSSPTTVSVSAFQAVGYYIYTTHRKHMFKRRRPFHSKAFKEFSTSHKLSPCQWLSIITRLYASFKYIRSLEASSPWGLKACPPPLLTFLKLPGIWTNDRHFNWTWITIYLILYFLL